VSKRTETGFGRPPHRSQPAERNSALATRTSEPALCAVQKVDKVLSLRSANNLISVTTRAATEAESHAFVRLGSNESRIAFLRKWASDAIQNDSKAPAQYENIIEQSSTADRAYFAACMLKRLDGIEGGLKFVERLRDPDSIRRIALQVIHDALALCSEFHALTIVDNERPIFTGTRNAQNLRESSRAANAARHNERCRERAQWNDEAAQIWARNPELSRQAVAKQLKLKLRLSERERTIAKQLKKPGTAG
jgi:hypothetical protein